MSFYETPRRNASDSTTASNRSTHRGHRREHSDPCPLPSPGLPHKALSTPELLRSKTVGDPCSAIRRSCSSLAALRCPEHVPPNADGFEELREGDEFFDNFSYVSGSEKKHKKERQEAIDTCSTIKVSSTTHNRGNHWAPLGFGGNVSRWLRN